MELEVRISDMHFAGAFNIELKIVMQKLSGNIGPGENDAQSVSRVSGDCQLITSTGDVLATNLCGRM